MMRPTQLLISLFFLCFVGSVFATLSVSISSTSPVQVVGSQIIPTLTIVSSLPVNATLVVTGPSFVTVQPIFVADTDFIGSGPYTAIVNIPHTFTDIGLASMSYSLNSTVGFASTTRFFEVVSGLEPSVLLSINKTGSALLLSVQTDVSSVCKFDYVSGSFADLAYTISTRSSSNKTHTYQVTDLFAKTYTFYVSCMNTKTGVFMSVPAEISYTVDVTTPRVLGHSPYQKSGDSLLLSIEVSEPSTCRYGLSDASYLALPMTFGSSVTATHSATLDLSYADATIYIRCSDASGNVMNASYVIVYQQDTPATARVELDIDTDEYIGAGLYDLTVFTTKSVRSEPRLQLVYVLDGSAKSIIVPLEKRSSVSWSGQLYIPESEFHGIAYFEFSAIDVDGLSSTQITDGSSLKISTKIPPTPYTVQVTSTDAKVFVKFDYPRFDFLSHYIIQKKSVDDPSYTARYTSEVREFVDTSVIPGESYWYSVLAVSRSGTYGQSTEPVKIVVSPKLSATQLNSSAQSEQQTALSYVMPDFLSGNLVTAQLDLEKTALYLSDKQIEYALFESIGVKNKNLQLLKNAQSTLKDSQKKAYTSNKDVSEMVSLLLEQTRQLKQQFVSQISVVEQTTSTAPISEATFESAFTQALSAKRIVGDVDTKSLLSFSKKLTSQYPLSIKISKLQLTYESGASELYTVFELDSEYVGDGDLIVTIPSEYSSLFYGQTSVLGSPIFIAKDIPVVLYSTQAIPLVKQQLVQGFILAPITYTGEGFGVGNFLLGTISSYSFIYYVLGFICIGVLLWFYFKPSSTISSKVLSSHTKSSAKSSRSWLSVVHSLFESSEKYRPTISDTSCSQTSQQSSSQASIQPSSISAKRSDSHLHLNHASSILTHSTGELSSALLTSQSLNSSTIESDRNSVLTSADVLGSVGSTAQDSSVSSKSALHSSVAIPVAIPLSVIPRSVVTDSQKTVPSSVAGASSVSAQYIASQSRSDSALTTQVFARPTTRMNAHTLPLGYHAVASHVAFITQDGKRLHSLIDLAFALSHMPDHVFAHHVNEHTHDFAQWIKDVYGYAEFAWHIKHITDKQLLSDTIYSFSQCTNSEFVPTSYSRLPHN
jgi:hypothetical protein